MKPFREWLHRFFSYLYKKIILPTIKFLHNWGIFELTGYIICFFFILEGCRFNPETGFYISLSGLIFSLPAFAYSTYLHSHKIKLPRNTERLTSMIALWITFCFIPMVF